MTFREAATEVLRAEQRPMKAEDITNLALRRQLIATEGKMPAATMAAQLYTDTKEHGAKSAFVQLGRNLWGLCEWDLSVLQKKIEEEEEEHAKGRRRTSRGLEDVWIEFEFRASSFRAHGHDPKQCDVIVCWENDWKDAPLEVLALKEIVSKA